LCEFPVPVLEARLEFENVFCEFRLFKHFTGSNLGIKIQSGLLFRILRSKKDQPT
jgi:hypothetical protein